MIRRGFPSLIFRGILLSLLFASITCKKPEETEVLWDTYGIPHIFASDAEGMFKAQGWAQMKAHGDLILRLYGQARGRAAEYWGEDYLRSDVDARILGIPILGAEWAAMQEPDLGRYLDAFVAGMNDYAAVHSVALSGFGESGSPKDLYEKYGLSASRIIEQLGLTPKS